MTVTVEQLERALTVLDQVVASVNIGRGTMTASYGPRMGGGSREHAPLPVDVDLIDKKVAAHRMLMDRALKVAMETDHPLTGRDPHSLTNYLYTRAAWITGQHWADDFHKALLTHAEGLDGARTRREPRVFAGRCAECETDLYATKGQPEARCTTCGTTYEVLKWRAHAKTALNYYIGTPAELSRALAAPEYGINITVDRIWRWGNRNKLERANDQHDPQGQPLKPKYRLSDVLDLHHKAKKKPIDGTAA
ncbi:hypothetical protein [Arthrobacter sp. StoSoilB13]|uniref:hypothetical protein n=1 Tax=Arthrobacter sp. StoSoilB13 TaxID=2830993 RepID=UPI001CC6A360|nr:hypothetical protein [Arthrobacter sp. StoSoilB13]BCW47924.1 hypothetical protein StoSoilB13_02660 [Arthrobacter sp. StoSoilB13]